MFNISFGEISLIVIVAALFLGVEECQAMMKFFRKTQKHANKYRRQIDKEIKKIECAIEENAEDIIEDLPEGIVSEAQTIITDLDGNPQVSYSLKDLEDKLKDSNFKASNRDNKDEEKS